MSTINTDVFNAEFYDKSNSAQFRDAQDLITKIIERNIKSADIIVDFGCGSGNVTEMLAKQLKHSKVYASDFNPKMIEYANKTHNNNGTIEYFVQDIGLPWEKLDERLRNLEGKVDLIWSNRALHWLNKDELKINATKTIMRLLRPGGSFFIHITQRRNLNEFLSDKEKEENCKLLKIETHEQQFNKWKKLFEDLGPSEFSMELHTKSWKYDTAEDYHGQFRKAGLEGWLSCIINDSVAERDKQNILDKFLPQLVSQFHTKYGQNFKVDAGSDIRAIYNELYQIIGRK